jgi:hypothetical protein
MKIFQSQIYGKDSYRIYKLLTLCFFERNKSTYMQLTKAAPNNK